jgi:tetratricopeptide (TPR) repeat protein
MMAVLRQYGAEMLSPEEKMALQRRHAEFFLALADEAGPLLHGPEQEAWLERLDAEHDNFRAALAWCLAGEEERSLLSDSVGRRAESREQRGESSEPASAAEIGLRLAEQLHFFWYVRGHVAEGRRWLAAFLAGPEAPEPTVTRAAALYAAARLASAQDDLGAACALYEKSLTIRRALERWRDVADALCQWGTVCEWMGDRVAAHSLYTQSLSIGRELNDAGLLAHILKCLGGDARARGDGESAREHLAESLSLYRDLGNTRGIASVLGEMARLALSHAENESAGTLLQEYLQLSRRLKDASHTAYALAMLGHLARERGDHRTACAHYAEALDLRRELGEKRESAQILLCLAASTRALGNTGAARAHLSEGLDLLAQISDPWVLASCLDVLAAMLLEPPDQAPVPTVTLIPATRLLTAASTLRTTAAGVEPWSEERPQHERRLALVRARLGEEQFAAVRAEACTMSREQVLAEARRVEL